MLKNRQKFLDSGGLEQAEDAMGLGIEACGVGVAGLIDRNDVGLDHGDLRQHRIPPSAGPRSVPQGRSLDAERITDRSGPSSVAGGFI